MSIVLAVECARAPPDEGVDELLTDKLDHTELYSGVPLKRLASGMWTSRPALDER